MSKTMLWSAINHLSATEQLLKAAERGCLRSVHELITQYAANPYSKDSNGMTALHFAAYNGHPAVCDYLVTELNDNAKITRDKCEKISNQLIDPYIKVQRLEYIVENKSKQQLDEKNDAGQTALFLATLMGLNYPKITEYQREFEKAKYNSVIRLLVNAGAQITEPDINNCKISGNYQAVEILTKAKKDKKCQQCRTAKTCTKLKL